MGRLEKTAKQLMDEGKWELLNSYTYGNSVVHYYAEKRSDGGYNVEYMYGVRASRAPLFMLVEVGCKGVGWVLDRLNKGLGKEVLGDFLEELEQVRKARTHHLRVGHAYTVYVQTRTCKTLDECRETAKKHFDKKIEDMEKEKKK